MQITMQHACLSLEYSQNIGWFGHACHTLFLSILALGAKKKKEEKKKKDANKLYSHAAVCQTGSSRGEGKAGPRSFQPAVWRCDRAEPRRLKVPPSNTEKRQMKASGC